jgi:membrane protease YdiL (CAAX protease family)
VEAHAIESPTRSWSVVDFLLVWLGGFLGTAVFFAIGLLFENSDWTIVLALGGQYIGNLLVLWLLKTRRRKASIGFSIEPRDTYYIGLGLALQLGLALLLLPLAERLFPDGRPPQQVAEALANLDGSMLLKVSLIVAAVVLAPVTEELLFRGVLLRAIEPRGKALAIGVSAAVFSAVHVIGLDQERILASAVVVLPPIFALGVLLGWITLRTGRLGPAIFIHSGWNLLAALVLLLPPELLETAS